MKKLPVDEAVTNPGQPPKGLVFERRPVPAHEIDVELHLRLMKTRAFKETTPEDFDRIRAELRHELGEV